MIPPRHIALIPDGNRRLAKRLMEQPWKGHEWGIQKLYNVLDWCREIGIKTITVYSLSLENLAKRPKDELNFLFLLARREMEKILSDPSHQVNKRRIRMIFFGRLDLLPLNLQKSISRVMEKTKAYKNYTVNFAMAYGGRQEILAAVNTLSATAKGKHITEGMFKKSLLTNGYGDPDLVIRTGGEKRLSNFLPYQTVYSELAFLDTFWPELTKKEFVRVIRDFSSRQRRFGQ